MRSYGEMRQGTRSAAVLLMALGLTGAMLAAPPAQANPAGGTRLLLTATRDTSAPPGPDSSVMTMRPDGSARRIIGHGNDAAWAPGQRRLVITAGTRVWVARSDGSHRRRFQPPDVARYQLGPLQARWSADGQWLYYLRTGRGEEPRGALYRAHVDGTHQQLLVRFPKNPFGIEPFGVAPDNRSVFVVQSFAPDARLWTYSTTGGPGRVLASLGGTFVQGRLDVSPNGRQLLLDGPIATTGAPGPLEGDIAVIEVDGSGLLSLGIRGHSAVWSPTGRRIAFLATATTPAVSSPQAIVAWPDGSHQHVLFSGNISSIDW